MRLLGRYNATHSRRTSELPWSRLPCQTVGMHLLVPQASLVLQREGTLGTCRALVVFPSAAKSSPSFARWLL